jgi:4-amino-4-deoxy-L-arabinose transferase-like glycosyltransferase
VVFSYMQGTVHPYYAVALAPPIAAIVAVAGRALWRGRCDPAARGVLAAMIAVTGGWDWVLLARTPSWLPALRWLVLGAGLAVAGLVLLGGHRLGRLTAVLATAAVLSVAAGTSAYAVDTAATPHNGPLPSSGPSTGGFGGRGGGPPAGGPSSGRRNPSGLGGGMGGPGRDGEASSNGQLTAALRATDTRWAAATTGARAAASLQLATGRAVMAVGGFTGNDPFPTLAQFQQDVSAGEIRYFVGGGTGGPDGGAAGQIAGWVAEHFTGTTIGGQTVYDLTKPTS